MRSGQGSGVRGIRLRRLMRRGLETGSRQTYTGTKLETADTAKGSLRGTAPVLDPTVEPRSGLCLAVLTARGPGLRRRPQTGQQLSRLETSSALASRCRDARSGRLDPAVSAAGG